MNDSHDMSGIDFLNTLWRTESIRPLIVAELSANHNQSLDRALKLVEAAADNGADAVKLQTFRPGWITLDSDRAEFLIQNPSSPWHGRRLFDLYAETALPLEWHEPLFAHAAKLGLLAFSAPFSLEAVEFLESLDCPAYKIASFECTDIPLIDAVAATGKPVVISTGMAGLDEIDEAVRTVRRHQPRGPLLLKCTSSYPAPVDSSNLRTMSVMRQAWNVPVGLSDHCLTPAAAVASVPFGCRLIEKHLTLNRADGGADAAFSLEPAEFSELTQLVADSHAALGEVRFGGTTDAEAHARQRRRSLYISADVRAGDVIGPENIRSVRPGSGLHTRHYRDVIGKRFRHDKPTGTPLDWTDID